MEQIHLPKLSRINKIIIIISVTLFVLDSMLKMSTSLTLMPFIGMSYLKVVGGHVWQVLTYPLLGNGVFEVVLNCLMLWMMGSDFEAQWGEKKYLTFLSAVTLGAAILAIVVAHFFPGPLQFFSLSGLSGIVTSLCVAYAFLYPDRLFSFMMIFPVKAKIFCLILAGISMYQGFFTPYAMGAWSQIGSMISGFLFMYFVTRKSGRKISREGQSMNNWTKRKKSKANLSIVRDDGNDSSNKPKYWH